MRVNAIRPPPGDHTGHASCDGRMRTVVADAGTAIASSAASTTSFFTAAAYG